MTAAMVPQHQRSSGHRTPVPWRRMAWVTWRQHRAALAGVIALLGALSLYFWLAGLRVHHAFAAVSGCHPSSSVACTTALTNFTSNYDHTANIIPALLQAAPALIGAFVGAPVLGRELETGTYRYAWTQGFGRWRWTLAKLVPLAVILAVAAGMFSLLFSWYYRPFIADGQVTPLTAIVFNLRGVDFAAWTLVAFSIGATAGMLIRRVVPAIVTTLLAYAGLAVVTATVLRHHYMTALVTKASVPFSALVSGTWGAKNGVVAFRGPAPARLLQQFCPPSVVGPGKPSAGAFSGCLSHHGYTLWASYQPARRFWPFQWIEGSWLLILSVLLITMTVALVHRRAT